MSRIAETFEGLADRHEGGLIAYVMGGDPSPAETGRIIDALIKGGADIVEVGIPFSDPIADGKSIQEAGVRALAAGTRPADVLEIVRSSRERHRVPFVLMTYFNIFYSQGVESFLAKVAESGADGVIIPDLPLDEVGSYAGLARARGLDMVLLASPTTTGDRMRVLVKNTSGFLYLVSLMGVTGARDKIGEDAPRLIRFAKKYSEGKVPLAVGFGISRPEHVSTVISAGADAAIVGSGIVNIIERNRGESKVIPGKIEEYVRGLKGATTRH